MCQPQNELTPAEHREDDADSSLGDDTQSSTASISSSILDYRNIHGRTFHSDRHATQYFTPNDQQQLESVDISHHYLMVLLEGKLFLAPIKGDVQRVLDVGTGSGIWAIDFADQYPSAEVVGTDISPVQPQWVPPNLRFEVDDATCDWTWKDNYFDFVHMRYLFGAIKDWNALLGQAYRCCSPGGWVQSAEADIHFRSDDGTTELEPVLKQCDELYEESGKILGQPFFVHDLQKKAFEEAGFTDIQTVTYKIPVGAWPKDSTLAEVGQFVKLTLENDIQGYTLFLAQNILHWPDAEYQVFLAQVRKAIRNRNVHSYFIIQYVYGRKPESKGA